MSSLGERMIERLGWPVAVQQTARHRPITARHGVDQNR